MASRGEWSERGLAWAERHARTGLAVGLAAALAVLLVYLIAAPKPWALEGGPGFFVPDRERPLRSNMLIGFWYAAAVNAGLCALLLATVRAWAAPLERRSALPVPRTGAGFRVLVVAAVLLAGALRWPLAHESLWWDEAWVVRTVVVGSYAPQDERYRVQEWDPGGWRRALWHYEKPTNHVLYSVAARGTVGAWKALTEAPREAFDEFAYRLPAFTAALLSVALAAAFLARLGFARAGVLAAFLLAIHPWHLRYGVDGRAYSFVVLFSLAGTWAVARLLRSGAWRDCALFAGSQLLLLWSFPYSIFVAATLGVTALVGILTSDRPAADRRRLALRFAAVNALAAVFLLQVFAPNLTQLPIWDYEVPVTASRLAELWTALATGIPRTGTPDAVSAGIPSLESLTAGHPLVPWVVWGLLPALVAVGLARVLRRGGEGRVAWLGLLLAGPATLVLTTVLEQQFYTRYAVFLLPGVVAGIALALDLGIGALERATGVRGPALALPLGAGALAAYQVLVWPQTRLLLTHPYAPLRQVAAVLDEADRREGEAVLRAGLGLGGGMVRLYDWDVRWIGREAEIDALCREAAAEGRPLYVFYGYPARNGAERAGAVARLEDGDRFERVAELYGIEPEFRFRVFRRRDVPCGEGGSARTRPTPTRVRASR